MRIQGKPHISKVMQSVFFIFTFYNSVRIYLLPMSHVMLNSYLLRLQIAMFVFILA